MIGLAEFIVCFVLSMSFPGMMYYIFFSCNFVFFVYKRKKETESYSYVTLKNVYLLKISVHSRLELLRRMFCDWTSRIYCLFCALHVFSRFSPVTVNTKVNVLSKTVLAWSL